MAAADARRLHRARGRKVGRAERDAVHARGGGGDRLDVLHALGGLQDRVDQDRAGDLVARLELRQQLVEIVDVPRPLDLGQHHHVELVAGRARRSRVMSSSAQGEFSALMRVHRPVVPKSFTLRHLDEARARRLLGVGGDRVLQIAEHHVDLARSVAAPWRGSSPHAAARNGSCARAAPAARGTGAGAPIASGLKKGRGSFMGVSWQRVDVEFYANPLPTVPQWRV